MRMLPSFLYPYCYHIILTSQSEELRTKDIRIGVGWIDLWRNEWSYSLHLCLKTDKIQVDSNHPLGHKEH